MKDTEEKSLEIEEENVHMTNKQIILQMIPELKYQLPVVVLQLM